MKTILHGNLTTLVVVVVFPAVAFADVRTKVAREAAEVVIERFGKEAAKEGVEGLARKIEALALKHGEEAIEAVRRVGPKAFPLIEKAGPDGAKVVKLMARFGNDSVIWIVRRPKGMAIFIKYGESGAEALVRHKGIAEPIIEKFNEAAVHALGSVNKQNGLRVAMMMNDGTLQKIGRTPALFEVIGKYGDKAMNFIWLHKAPLAVAAVLTAFLANPEPFIDGARDISKIVSENVVKPSVEALEKPAAETTGQIAQRTNWTLIGSTMVIVAGLVVGFRAWLRGGNRR